MRGRVEFGLQASDFSREFGLGLAGWVSG